jgi:hypothetical protein
LKFIGRNQELHFGGEGLFYATSQTCLHTIYLADSLTELLLQHLKQEEVAVVKGSVLSGLGNLLDGDNRY